MKALVNIFRLALIVLIVSSCENNQLTPQFDCESSTLSISLQSQANSHCGIADGSLTVLASLGEAPYRYSVDGDNFQDSGVFTELTSGTYQVVVQDANGCTATTEVTILNEDGLNINVSVSESGCDTSLGQINIVATDGVQPYSFSIDGSSFTSTGNFDQLSAGEYTIVARDASGCEVTQSVTVLTGISFGDRVAEIISTNCAISGCHADAISPRMNDFASIKQNADRIRFRTSQKTMPPSGPLSDDEIAAIACWVNDGALNN
ncbi:c-type cytochrome [Roseivirga sp.]|uniref:c-type cytochrome n=1 Tax=Roseivirga sp. TaxID=1964215 RepID=UPI003B5295EB